VVTDKVWHELAFGLESLGYDTPTIRRRVAEVAAFFGIENWFYKNVTELSGGQKQLLSLASVMAMNPQILVLEPTYKHLLLIDVAEWNGSIVLDDGLFLACDASLKQKAVARSNISSAVAGGEGLFNLGIAGKGILCLESHCPKEELVEINLVDDVLKVDGNMAIAWSGSLDFTVERSGKTLLGSAASGEGLVNVYRGTGRVLLAPVMGN
jgi:uncharacterized protein (AIM24 family)